MDLCNSTRHDCSYMNGSSDLNARNKLCVCAVLFIPIAAGPLLLELLLDRFAGAALYSTLWKNSEIVVRQSQLIVVSGVSLILVGAHTRARL